MGHTPETRRRAYEKMLNRRKQWFESVGNCKICGSSERLEVHHRDPSVKVSHNVWSWEESRMLEELAKCDPLCNRCHLAETKKYLSVEHLHGTFGKYMRGCRCEDCTTANRKKVQNRRLLLWGSLSSRPKKNFKYGALTQGTEFSVSTG